MPGSTNQRPAPKTQVRAAKNSSEGRRNLKWRPQKSQVRAWLYFSDLFLKFLAVGVELRWVAYTIRISLTSSIIWTQLVFLVNYPFKKFTWTKIFHPDLKFHPQTQNFRLNPKFSPKPKIQNANAIGPALNPSLQRPCFQLVSPVRLDSV